MNRRGTKIGPAPGDAGWRLTVGALAALTFVAVWACDPDRFGGGAALAGFTAIVVAGGLTVGLLICWQELAAALKARELQVPLLAAVGVCTFFLVTGSGGFGFIVALLLMLAGATLIAGEVRAEGDARESLISRSGWQAITEGRLPEGSTAREVGGVVLIALALLLFALLTVAFGGAAFQIAVFVLLIGGAILFALGMSSFARNVGSGAAGGATINDMVSRQEVSAHLHDSVLQTLALIQRKADDPEAVSRLARRQEASLRLWLSGDGSDEGGTVAAALRSAIEQVEDEESVVIDTTIMGNRSSDERSEALVAAVREALRNAARHADASTISLYAEINEEGVEAFVRDDGKGFDDSTVPPARRGVRDSIVARMIGVGGSAKVQSTPGAGTEVQLSIQRGEGSA
jgi:nitrate reductase NapE component